MHIARDTFKTLFLTQPAEEHGRNSAGSLLIRPFGHSRRDIEINFSLIPKVELITKIIACCTVNGDDQQPEDSFFWGLTIGKRTEALMAAATLDSTSVLTLQLRCQNQDCLELMEVEITQAEITHLQQQSDKKDSFSIPVSGRQLQMRKPTGNDQLKWLEKHYHDESDALCHMIRSLFVDHHNTDNADDELLLLPESMATINKVMGDVDPLVDFSMAIECPFCMDMGEHQVDLEDKLLQLLERKQQKLLASIHKLASCYHWTEEEVFAIPSWRRNRYLAMIAKEEV